ncbi:MAG: protein kinase [Raineya sp.]|jgi:serine/threonine protein kinase|nr:protein kinase [Raineya sp.]
MQGRKIQNYIIESIIGEGGMGTVYKAHHALMQERKAAIKVLNPHLSKNIQIKERFKNEASALARLNHSSIVALYDYIEEGDEAFLVMEYAEGVVIDDLIKQSGKIAEVKAKDILRQIAEALAYAHSQGIVHRDIKPSNFIITPENKVKILDFGIAKMLSGESRHLTKTGMRMGSIYFMSPEQVRGDKDITHRTDIYSLGLMYYVMLTGKYPLEQLTSEYTIYDTIVNKDFIDIQALKGSISETSIAVLQKCLQRNPQDRFATALDIIKVLDNTIPIEKEINNPTPAIQKNEVPTKPETTTKGKSLKKWYFALGLWVILMATIVIFYENISSFIQENILTKKEDSEEKTKEEGVKMYVTSTNLNLRNFPQTGSVITTIPYGEVVYVLGESNQSDWVRVRYNDKEGFVFKHYIADHVKPVYKVTSPQAYFYLDANYENPMNAYLIAGQFILAEETKGNFIFTNFIYNGKTTSGWIDANDLERVK